MPTRRSFKVPDLTPRDRPELHGVRFRVVFVAESPHVKEVEPVRLRDRRPLCGSAGKAWWGALTDILERRSNNDLSLPFFLKFCRKHRIAVMNAVQLPLDPGITKHFTDADPLRHLGFSKQVGPGHYRHPSDSRDRALRDLRRRLLDPSLDGARIIALGNDADWFVAHALSENERAERAACKIPHPSAWWRRGGYFGRVARESLREVLKKD